jgi:hypothetical protein
MQELPTIRKEVNIIGYAGMTQDGTILMRVRQRGFESTQRNVVFCAPGDHNYAQVFAHLGGISPGQKEPLTRFAT